MIADAVELRDGDVLVVTQKIVSKAENRFVEIDGNDPVAKRELAESEAVRVLRRRGEMVITETKHGFICANSGIDLSKRGRWLRRLVADRPPTVRPVGSVTRCEPARGARSG